MLGVACLLGWSRMCGGLHPPPTPSCPCLLPAFAAGIFLGAAVVFFSQVGFDAIANAAEEVGGSRGPARVCSRRCTGA